MGGDYSYDGTTFAVEHDPQKKTLVSSWSDGFLGSKASNRLRCGIGIRLEILSGLTLADVIERFLF